MMKKIISLLLALVFAVSAFSICASATYQDYASTKFIQYGTTAHDLKAYGISTYLAYKVNTPGTIDGQISAGEYGTDTPTMVATLGNGLSLTNSSGTADYTEDYGNDYQNFSVSTFLAYDNQYLYIAEKVVGDRAISVATATGNSTLNTNVRIGMNQSLHIPEAASRLSNSYSYRLSGSGFVPSDVSSGNRTYKVIKGEVTKTVTLDDEHYSDWTREKYAENTAISYSVSGSNHTYVFEYKIPIADIAYSNYGNFDESNVSQLLSLPELWGSYFFQVAVTRTGGSNNKTHLFLSTGHAGNETITSYCDASITSTWAKAIRDYWTTKNEESLAVAYVPTPVLFAGEYDPSFALPAGSSFRSALSGFEFGVFKSTYSIGEQVNFAVVPDNVELTDVQIGDQRVIPTKFTVRNGSQDLIVGQFSSDFRNASFSTATLPVGVNTLVVTFVQQAYTENGWTDTNFTKNLSRNFYVAGSVRGTVDQGSSQTGDSSALVILGAVAMLSCAAVVAVVVSTKSKKKAR